MVKQRRLACSIQESDTEGMYLVSATLVDGTPFQIKTSIHDVIFKTRSKKVPAEGFLRVQEFGVHGDKATIVLPSPSLTHGKNVCVSINSLL